MTGKPPTNPSYFAQPYNIQKYISNDILTVDIQCKKGHIWSDQKTFVIGVWCAEEAEGCNLSSEAWYEQYLSRNETACVQVSSTRTVTSASVAQLWR